MIADIIRTTGIEICGRSSGKRKSGKETCWWSEEIGNIIKTKREKLKKWKTSEGGEGWEEYKSANKNAKQAVGKGKMEQYDRLYEQLDTKEGEKNIFRIAAERNRKSKDVKAVRTVKDENGNVLKEDNEIKERWRGYFEKLMNEENERIPTEQRESIAGPIGEITRREVEEALKTMKNGKATGPDEIPAEIWKYLGQDGVIVLYKLFNAILRCGRIPEAWRMSILIPIYKGKGDVLECSNYRGIKLLSHTFKIWERIIDKRLRELVHITEIQQGFMPGKSTTDAIFAVRQLTEKYREGRNNLYMIFIDLEKAYDRVPREEIWRCLRAKGVPEVYVGLIMDMYENCSTTVRCEAGDCVEFDVRVGLHQGSALSPFLFILLLDVLTEGMRRRIPWSILYADDGFLCGTDDEELNREAEEW